MATKPVTLPRWANVSGSLVTPSSGKQDVGSLPGEKPTAQVDNWLRKWTYDWCKFVSDSFDANGNVIDSNRFMMIPGRSFLPASSGAGITPGAGFISPSSNISMTFEAHLPLPAGKRILSLAAYYNVGGAGSITPGAQRTTITTLTGTQTAVWAGIADTTGSTIESQASAALNHTMLSTDAYTLTCVMTNTVNKLYGILVNYDS